MDGQTIGKIDGNTDKRWTNEHEDGQTSKQIFRQAKLYV